MTTIYGNLTLIEAKIKLRDFRCRIRGHMKPAMTLECYANYAELLKQVRYAEAIQQKVHQEGLQPA